MADALAAETLPDPTSRPGRAVQPHAIAWTSPASGRGSLGSLTPREQEVAVRIAQGQSNQGIGTALGISERTVERHVAKIFAKLAVHSRARIAAWAVECRLMREAP